MLADTRDGLRTPGTRTLDRLLGLREVPAATAVVFQDELYVRGGVQLEALYQVGLRLDAAGHR